MARAVAFKQNGIWLVKVDVDNYGGDDMRIRDAEQFARDVSNAIHDAKNNNARDRFEK